MLFIFAPLLLFTTVPNCPWKNLICWVSSLLHFQYVVLVFKDFIVNAFSTFRNELKEQRRNKLVNFTVVFGIAKCAAVDCTSFLILLKKK